MDVAGRVAFLFPEHFFERHQCSHHVLLLDIEDVRDRFPFDTRDPSGTSYAFVWNTFPLLVKNRMFACAFVERDAHHVFFFVSMPMIPFRRGAGCSTSRIHALDIPAVGKRDHGFFIRIRSSSLNSMPFLSISCAAHPYFLSPRVLFHDTEDLSDP